MNITVNECFELNEDFQNQFIGNGIFPEPKYTKMRLSERTVKKIHYKDVYILKSFGYYYITFNEDISGQAEEKKTYVLSFTAPFALNGILLSLDAKKNRLFLFNATQNVIYLQKGTKIGEVKIWMSIYKC